MTAVNHTPDGVRRYRADTVSAGVWNQRAATGIDHG